LEELIKTRIRDQAWDDVEPKSADDVLVGQHAISFVFYSQLHTFIASIDIMTLIIAWQPFKPRIQIEMNQEKSKESLAEIYEKVHDCTQSL
jgi:hypothetical protein